MSLISRTIFIFIYFHGKWTAFLPTRVPESPLATPFFATALQYRYKNNCKRLHSVLDQCVSNWIPIFIYLFPNCVEVRRARKGGHPSLALLLSHNVRCHTHCHWLGISNELELLPSIKNLILQLKIGHTLQHPRCAEFYVTNKIDGIVVRPRANPDLPIDTYFHFFGMVPWHICCNLMFLGRKVDGEIEGICITKDPTVSGYGGYISFTVCKLLSVKVGPHDCDNKHKGSEAN